MPPFFFRRPTKLRVLSFAFAVFCIINFSGSQAAQARFEPDNNFAPVLVTENYGPHSILVLPGGKLLTIRLSTVNVFDNQQYKVTRLNADGGVDRVFDSVVMAGGDGKLLLQADGKILLMTYGIVAARGENLGGIIRLNADGTLDTSFNANWISFAAGALIQPDGRIVVGATFLQGSTTMHGLLRLNADGSRDQSYFAFLGAPWMQPLALQPDGKIIMGYGRDNPGKLERFFPDGVLDVDFRHSLPSFGPVNSAGFAVVQSDGKIIVGGSGVMRLNGSGTHDAAFPAYDAYGGFRVEGMIRQPDDKVIIGGSGWYNNTAPMKKRLTRINADGTQDAGFDAMTRERWGLDTLTPLALRPNGTILVRGSLTQGFINREGLLSLNQNGAIDQSFVPDLGSVRGVAGLLARQPDGKILVAGYFARVDNHPTFNLVRLHGDGSVDTGFSFSNQITMSGAYGYSPIETIAFQPDGKILIGGDFRYNGQENYGVFRLNQNGSIDSTFTPNTFIIDRDDDRGFGVNSLHVLPNGKILVGGIFFNYANSVSSHLVRLNPNGSVDASYDVTANGVWKMLVQPPDGKIIIVGSVTRNGLTITNPRLNADGSFDPTFSMPDDVGTPYAVAPDGKLATAGLFSISNHSFWFVFRLKPDGSLDTSFTSTRLADSSVVELFFQQDGRIIVNTGVALHRLNGSGSVEPVFSQSYAYAYMMSTLVTPGKNLLVGGRIFSINGSNRAGVARFLLGSKDYDFDGDNRADVSLFRPASGDWCILRSSDGVSLGLNFGLPNDSIAPADFDGDGRTDISVFRPADGGWYRLNSSNNTFTGLQFGSAGDVPVPADFDGDGRADIVVYRPSAGSWYRLNSSNNQFVGAQFGIAEDKPVIGDFDGDGRADLAVFRPSNGTWYRIDSSNNQFVGAQFGVTEDKPAAADYDGDGKTDLAVYRPSAGSWYRVNSSNNSFAGAQFGIAEDKPAPADFDGDGKADLAVFRPSNATWYLLRSTQGFVGIQYGESGDVPAPNAFVR